MKRRLCAEQLGQATRTLNQFEEDAKLARERLAGYAREQGVVLEQIERAKLDMESGENQLSVLEAERQSVQDSVQSIEAEVLREKASLDIAVAEEKQASLAYLDARSELEKCFRREAEQKHEVTMQQYRIRSGEERKRQAEERFERLSQEQDLTPRIKDETSVLHELAQSLDEARSRVERLEIQRQSSHDWARAFNAGHDRMKREFEEARAEMLRTEARCDSLIQLQAGAEMWGRGTKLLLARPEVVEPLIDQFSSDEAERRSGIAVLDRAAEPLVVKDFEQAIRCVNEVTSEQVAVSLVLEELGWAAPSAALNETLGSCQLTNELIMGRLFSGACLVRELGEAPGVFDANGSVDLVVTREGHAVTRSGVIRTWGKSVIDEVLEQKSEIERLKNVYRV